MLDKQTIKVLQYIRKHPNADLSNIEKALRIDNINVIINFLYDEKYIQGTSFYSPTGKYIEPYVITPKGILSIYEKRTMLFKDILLPIILTIINVIGIPFVGKFIFGL